MNVPHPSCQGMVRPKHPMLMVGVLCCATEPLLASGESWQLPAVTVRAELEEEVGLLHRGGALCCRGWFICEKFIKEIHVGPTPDTTRVETGINKEEEESLYCSHICIQYTCNKADDHTQVPVLNCNNHRVIGITRLG